MNRVYRQTVTTGLMDRFVILPIQNPDVWSMYKKVGGVGVSGCESH